jgi:bacterioferritin
MNENPGSKGGFVRCIETAINDEWLAHYQYWVGSVLVDDQYENVISEFVEHSSDEYDHATELAYWMTHQAKEGNVFTDPRAGIGPGGMQFCDYIPPSSSRPESLIFDALKGERCAVRFYEGLIKMMPYVEGWKNIVELLEDILEKEKEHVSDLENLKRFIN